LALVNQNGNLKRDPLSDWQPVKIAQNGRDYEQQSRRTSID